MSSLSVGEMYTSMEINMAELPAGTVLRCPVPEDDGCYEYLFRRKRRWLSTHYSQKPFATIHTSYYVVYLPEPARAATQPAAAASEKDAK